MEHHQEYWNTHSRLLTPDEKPHGHDNEKKGLHDCPMDQSIIQMPNINAPQPRIGRATSVSASGLTEGGHIATLHKRA